MAVKYPHTEVHGWSLTNRSLIGSLFLGAFTALASFIALAALGGAVGMLVVEGAGEAQATGVAWYSGIWLLASAAIATFGGAWVGGHFAPVGASRSASALGIAIWATSVLLMFVMLSSVVNAVAFAGGGAMLMAVGGGVLGAGAATADQLQIAAASAGWVSGWFFLTSLLSMIAGALGAAAGHKTTDMPLAGAREQFERGVMHPEPTVTPTHPGTIGTRDMPEHPV